MIWATVNSRSCFCWLHRAFPSLAAKNIISLILVLTIWWCPCVESKVMINNKGLLLENRTCCCCGCLVTKSCPTLTWSHGLQSTVLLCPWNFPGKNTGAGCHFLLQGIFPTQTAGSKDITLLTKVRIVKAIVFLLVIYGWESWTIKTAEYWRIDAFQPLEKTLESPLNHKEIKLANPKWN